MLPRLPAANPKRCIRAKIRDVTRAATEPPAEDSRPDVDLASPARRRPTVKDVARLAGVSPMSVSRTIAGGQGVRPEIREKVEKAAAALGYRRNDNARRMRGGRASGLIGVAITNLANPYYANFALGVEEVAARQGRRILIGSTGEDLQRERQLVADFIGRQVEGLVLVPAGGAVEHLQPASMGSTPLVLASRTVEGVEADAVLLDDIGGAYEGTCALLDAGHRRIAYLGNVGSVSTGQRRFAGFTAAIESRGVRVVAALVKRGQQDVQAAREAMDELLDLKDPPTGVFCANNRNTIGALEAIGARMGSSRPPAVTPAIVSFDNFELAELMPTPVTVIDHDAHRLGRECAHLLFSRMAPGGEQLPVRRIEMKTELVVIRT